MKDLPDDQIRDIVSGAASREGAASATPGFADADHRPSSRMLPEAVSKGARVPQQTKRDANRR